MKNNKTTKQGEIEAWAVTRDGKSIGIYNRVWAGMTYPIFTDKESAERYLKKCLVNKKIIKIKIKLEE